MVGIYHARNPSHTGWIPYVVCIYVSYDTAHPRLTYFPEALLLNSTTKQRERQRERGEGGGGGQKEAFTDVPLYCCTRCEVWYLASYHTVPDSTSVCFFYRLSTPFFFSSATLFFFYSVLRTWCEVDIFWTSYFRVEDPLLQQFLVFWIYLNLFDTCTILAKDRANDMRDQENTYSSSAHVL